MTAANTSKCSLKIVIHRFSTSRIGGKKCSIYKLLWDGNSVRVSNSCKRFIYQCGETDETREHKEWQNVKIHRAADRLSSLTRRKNVELMTRTKVRKKLVKDLKRRLDYNTGHFIQLTLRRLHLRRRRHHHQHIIPHQRTLRPMPRLSLIIQHNRPMRRHNSRRRRRRHHDRIPVRLGSHLRLHLWDHLPGQAALANGQFILLSPTA